MTEHVLFFDKIMEEIDLQENYFIIIFNVSIKIIINLIGVTRHN